MYMYLSLISRPMYAFHFIVMLISCLNTYEFDWHINELKNVTTPIFNIFTYLFSVAVGQVHLEFFLQGRRVVEG